MHLAVANGYVYLRDNFLEPMIHGLYGLHPIMNKENLSAPVDFAQDSRGNYGFIIIDNFSYNRAAVFGRGCYQAHVARTHQGHLQCARNRRSGHRHSVNRSTQFTEFFFVFNAETMLFIYNEHSQIFKSDIF